MITKQIKGNKMTLKNDWILYKTHDGYSLKVDTVDFEEILRFVHKMASNKTEGNKLVKGYREFLKENNIYKITNIKELITNIDDYATAIKKVEENIYSFKNHYGELEYYSKVLDAVFDSVESVKHYLQLARA